MKKTIYALAIAATLLAGCSEIPRHEYDRPATLEERKIFDDSRRASPEFISRDLQKKLESYK